MVKSIALFQLISGVIIAVPTFAGPMTPNHNPSLTLTTARTRNFSASQDAAGHIRSATAQVNAGGTITCTSASGVDPKNYPPQCYLTISPAGGAYGLSPGQSGGTGPGGTMMLICNGKGQLACSVRVND